jgi:hypothetical protein
VSDDGSFSDATRAAIYMVGSGRCIGCGRPDLTAQHRSARGKGGTSGAAALVLASAANGVPLCGDGVRGCHGWTEANPEWAELLGWRVPSWQHPADAPFWTRFAWGRWVMVEGCPAVAYVDVEEDLDRVPERLAAVTEYRRALGVREERAAARWAAAGR